MESKLGQGSTGGHIALQAACRVSRIVEDMLSQEIIQYGQMHWYGTRKTQPQ